MKSERKQGPRAISRRRLYIEELEQKPALAASKSLPITTMAVGEEADGPVTTLALGEECGLFKGGAETEE